MSNIIKKLEALFDSITKEAVFFDRFITEENKPKYREKKENQAATIMEAIEELSRPPEEITVFGQPMPHDNDLEMIILGALLCDGNYFPDKIQPEHFYSKAHAAIFAAMERLHFQKKPIDIITVAAEIGTNHGGPAYLALLTNRVASTANTSYHCALLFSLWERRKAIIEAIETIKNAQTGPTHKTAAQ